MPAAQNHKLNRGNHHARDTFVALSLCSAFFGHEQKAKGNTLSTTPPPIISPALLTDDDFSTLQAPATQLAYYVPGPLARPNTADSKSSTSSEQKKSTDHKRSTAAILGALLFGGLGYLNYIARAVPEEARKNHLASRLGRKLLSNLNSYPGNTTSLRIYVLNHASVLLTGIALAAQSQNSLAGLAGLATPLVFLLGSSEALRLSTRYGGQYPVNNYVKSCAGLAYLTLGLFLASTAAKIAGYPFTIGGIDPKLVGITLGLSARFLSIVPMASDFVREARSPSADRGFPALKNHAFWSVAGAFGLLTVKFPLDATAIIPIGYFAQNLLTWLLGVECYRRYRNKIDQQKTES